MIGPAVEQRHGTTGVSVIMKKVYDRRIYAKNFIVGNRIDRNLDTLECLRLSRRSALKLRQRGNCVLQ